ncbi:hypothetical protein N7G274_010552 [Stereocaulon virgatum]|uniref:Beta-hexosaminidase n=1 Tax=Stereocaulon virgatum TaxID=373712 RepID=A0ABR3ZVL8_9LECA
MHSKVTTQILTICVLTICTTALWPLPLNYTHGSTYLWLSPDVTFSYQPNSGVNLTASALYANSTSQNATNYKASTGLDSYSIVQAAIARTQDELSNDGFVPWKFHPRNSFFEPPSNVSYRTITNVTIQQNSTDPANVLKPLAGAVDESYSIVIAINGAVMINAVSSVGIIRALETFSQLFYTTADGSSVYTNLAPVYIEDAPKFQYRGLNMDIARSPFTPDDIMRTIDALAYNKFNILHLHATDAQSWTLQIPALPPLADLGAYMKGLSYSPGDLENIQSYGAYRGVQVIIETDVPGHTAAIGLSYPDLVAALNVQPGWSNYSAEPPTGQLKLNDTAVYDFLDKLWADLLPRVYPFSAYFHTGGDEVNANVYGLDPTVRSNDTKVIQPLLQKMIDHNHAKVRAAGMARVVWEERLLEWNLTLGADVVVQTWQTDTAVANVVAKGHKALAGDYNYWYLDCGRGQWIDFSQSTAEAAWPFSDYCTPTKNWRLMYTYDPLAGVPANATKLVLGGEVHIWSEQVDGVNLDNMVWPRACAAAEVLWSGSKDASGKNRSQITASPRLGEMRERMVQRGIGAGPVQMIYCTQNGTQCTL